MPSPLMRRRIRPAVTTPFLTGLAAYLPLAADLADHGSIEGLDAIAPAGSTQSGSGGPRSGYVGLASASSQYLQLPPQFLRGATDFSVSLWLYHLGGTGQWAFSYGVSSSSGYIYLTPNAGAKGLRCAITDTNFTDEQEVKTNSAMGTNAWHHVAITLKGGTLTLYLDGVQVAVNTAVTFNNSTWTAPNFCLLGKSLYGGDPFYNGRMAEVAIYSRALLASEVAMLYSSVSGSAYPFANVTTPAVRYRFASFLAPPGVNETLRMFRGGKTDYFVETATAYAPGGGRAVRDPSLYVQDSAHWWLAHTNQSYTVQGNFSIAAPTFSVASSADQGATWTLVGDVNGTGPVGTRICWAPEWFVDSAAPQGVRVLYAECPAGPGNFQLYETHPTNAAFTAWSAPAAVAANIRTSVIDPFMQISGSVYNLWYKDQSTNFVEYASASSLFGAYTRIGSGNWAGWGSGLEGWCMIQEPSGRWSGYLDPGTAAGFKRSYSDDVWATWSAPVTVLAAKAADYTVAGIRHGTVVRFY